MRAPSSSIWAVVPPSNRAIRTNMERLLVIVSDTQEGTRRAATRERSADRGVEPTRGRRLRARGRGQPVRELAAEAGEVLGRQVVAGVGVEEHAGLSRLLVVAGPDQHGDVDPRQGDEAERRVAERERVAAGRARRRAEGVEVRGRPGERARVSGASALLANDAA